MYNTIRVGYEKSQTWCGNATKITVAHKSLIPWQEKENWISAETFLLLAHMVKFKANSTAQGGSISGSDWVQTKTSSKNRYSSTCIYCGLVVHCRLFYLRTYGLTDLKLDSRVSTCRHAVDTKTFVVMNLTQPFWVIQSYNLYIHKFFFFCHLV